MAKLSKAAVDYSRGKREAHCGLCKHYLGNAACEIVAGPINPAMWCDRYVARNKDSDMTKKRKPRKGGGY